VGQGTHRDVIGRVELAAAALFIGLFAYTAIGRLAFPFDLEWQEGALMDHVLRVSRDSSGPAW
jgi:hypothetical protein